MKKLLLGSFIFVLLFFIVSKINAGWLGNTITKKILQIKTNLSASVFNAYSPVYYDTDRNSLGYYEYNGSNDLSSSYIDRINPITSISYDSSRSSLDYYGNSNSDRNDLNNNYIDRNNSTKSTVQRVMFSVGKYDQHFDVSSQSWKSDQDKSINGYLDILSYCKKWYPDTISTRVYKQESIDTWVYSYNNHNNDSIKSMSYECVLGAVAPDNHVTTNAYVNLVYPKSGETFKAGQNVEIKIDSNLTRLGSFRALIYKKSYNNQYIFIKKFDISNSGVQNIKIPLGTPTGEYKIEYGHIFSDNGYTQYGVSIFSIISASSIKLLSPVSGSTLQAGQTVNVKWSKSSDLSNSWVGVIIRKNGEIIRQTSIINDGQEYIKIPSNTPAGLYNISIGIQYHQSSGGGGTNYFEELGSATVNIITRR